MLFSFSSLSSAFCHDVSNKLVWVVGAFSHPAIFLIPLQATTPHRFPKNTTPVIFWEKPLLHQPTKIKNNEKKQTRPPHPRSTPLRSAFPFPRSGKTRSNNRSPHQWHRRRVDNVSQVEGHNSWIRRCSLWKNVGWGMLDHEAKCQRLVFFWCWLVASS